MNELLEKFDVEEGLYIYLQRNSKVWLARFKIDGKWISRTTKQRKRNDAYKAALKLRAEYDLKLKHGIAIQTKAFKEVAKLALERMQNQPANTKGFTSLIDYKQALERYHIPFFDRTHITRIDYEKLAEFDAWRIQKMGRIPAASTLKTHNAAMQRVFDEAVMRKWMTQSNVPSLSAAAGVTTERRDYFTPEEVTKISEAFPAWIEESRKEITRNTRELLFFYFNVAVHTGLRPGTEMDNLKWCDLQMHKKHVVIAVRKGKTTLHTGTRHVVGHLSVLDMILDMSKRFEEVKDGDLVFRMWDGKASTQLGRNFTVLLKRLGLEETANGKRSLYSLRHTYITLKLLEGLAPAVIARQCGTSIAMIQQHYDHLTSLMHVKELVGSDSAELTKLINKYADLD
jgi:hypothetical protein